MTRCALLWTCHFQFTTEHVVVEPDEGGWSIRGTAIAVYDDQPTPVNYSIG